MTHATVFIIMDAGRSDYVRPDTMPFLAGLQKQSTTGQFLSPPGFAQRTVLFSGRYPDTSNNFSAFIYDPDASPFKWVRRLGPLRGLIRPRKVTWPTRKLVEKTTKAITGAYHTDPAWIPPKFLPYFRPCEDMKPLYEPGALGATSLFDLCRQTGKRFRYLAHPVSGDDEEIHQILVRELRSGAPYDFYVAQFSVTDQRGHIDGPFSEAMQKRHLRELDEKFATIHAALTAGYDSWDLFICGDHGMGPVQTELNLLKTLKKIDAKPSKDYVVFVNSTLAVFWYLSEKGRNAIEAALPTIAGTKIIGEEERKRLRIPLNRQWGDRMLAADPGVMFWPDYFHVVDSKIVGMHGYLDKSQETLGAMVLASSRDVDARDVGPRSLVDVFPTLCQLLELPLPDTNEGKSLLSRPPGRNGHEPRPARAPVPVPQVVA
jgi:hypothetical protein